MKDAIMKTLGLDKVRSKLPCSSVNVVYKSKTGLWRGFVQPYAVTYEAETKDEVISVLRSMTEQYEKGLERYDSPEHLKIVPLSDEEDIEKFTEISMELMNHLLTKRSKVNGLNYYAEAKLSA